MRTVLSQDVLSLSVFKTLTRAIFLMWVTISDAQAALRGTLTKDRPAKIKYLPLFFRGIQA